MPSEFNKTKYKNESNEKDSDNKAYKERVSAEEDLKYKENLSYNETSQDKIQKKIKKKKQSSNNLFSTMAATVAVVAAAVVILPTVTDSKIEANFSALYSTDSSIYYELEVENIDSEVLTLVVYNDFTKREVNVSKDENFGEVKDLKENMYYKVAIKSKNKTLTEKELRTKKAEEMPVTELYSVTHECTCNLDGLFHFSIDFIDQKNIWSDFKATMTDSYGNIGECVFTDNLLGGQTIDIVGNGLLGNTAEFKITCFSSGQEIILYQKNVQI